MAGLEIAFNVLTAHQPDTFAGILLMGGLTLDERGTQYTGSAQQNTLENVSVTCNQVKGGKASILAMGGRGPRASDNHILGLLLVDNQVDTAPVITNDDAEANRNTVEMAPGKP